MKLSHRNEIDSSNIFQNLKFHISDNLNHPAKLEQLSKKIKNSGGKRNISPSHDSIFVLNQFFDEEYRDCRNHGVPIISVSYLEECVVNLRTIDLARAKNTPIHSDCLLNKVVCFDRSSEPNCKEMAMKVTAMGGQCTSKLTTDTFILVTQNICSRKSKNARQKLNIPLVTSEWVERCWQDGFLNDPALFSKPVLRGCVICLTGFSGNDRKYIEQLSIEGGGVFAPTLNKNECTHLVASEQSGEKFKMAKEWGVYIVPLQWLEESVRVGLPQSELLFNVDSGTGTIGSYDNGNSSSSLSLRQSVNSYIPTPLPQPITNLSMDMSLQSISYNNNDVDMLQANNGYNQQQLLQLTCPPSDIFRSMTFVLMDFNEEQEAKTMELVSSYAQIIVAQQVPNLLSTQLTIDYVLAPHDTKLNKDKYPSKAKLVSTDWFDACLRYNRILDPRECVLYTPIQRVGFLKGVFLVYSGFTVANVIDNIRITSHLLGAKIFQKQGKQSTHLLVHRDNYRENPEYKKAMLKNKNSKSPKIYILHLEWLFDCAKQGRRIDEYDYLFTEVKQLFKNRPQQQQQQDTDNSIALPLPLPLQTTKSTSISTTTTTESSIFKGFKVYISLKIEEDKQNQYQVMVRDLGGETTLDLFTVTHYICERINHSETQRFVQTHTIINARPDWLIKCWEENKLIGVHDYIPLDPIENDDDLVCQPPVIQPITKQHSQLFNGTPKSNDQMDIEIETENDHHHHHHHNQRPTSTTTTTTAILSTHPPDLLKQATQETDSEEEEEEEEIDDKPSALDRLFKAINNLPEQKNNVNSNVFTIPSIVPKRKAISKPTNAIIPVSTVKSTSLDLANLDDDDDDLADMTDGVDEDEEADPLSQRITYGEGSENVKRLKLMNSKATNKNKTKDNSTEQQHLLDILKKGQPIQSIVVKTFSNYLLLSGFGDKEKIPLMDSLSKIEKFGFYHQSDPNITPGKTTHLIVCLPKRSEKFLCALAAGIWCLKPTFLDAIIATNQPVDEAAYEWTTADRDDEWTAAASKCRKAANLLQRPLLSRVKIVIPSSHKSIKIWTNIFNSGGATVLDENEIAEATHRMSDDNQIYSNDPPHIKKVKSSEVTHLLIHGQHLITD
ncbi:BRCT domain-containing protein [Heterostelium album PN500]|uniref:BRCT domain-containing protein n=1 Tax=Heterostelium pallidum (strain ATCC 26659 / Pp 5 / PN500) TaxID=670386 RepID=D3BB36_HETP5|nr:BRCT domain-containing protein [Heterostelium album PN500]EFA81773.1 BRCT domain-containing protein [Heterostelium album PN500]|eukprot:XP_020433890.1 BRCT domain-containing protein [Heterostelium album PN500]